MYQSKLKGQISQISNLGPQFHENTPNQKLKTLLYQIPPFGIDGINEIPFRDSKLQKKLKSLLTN